MTLDLIVFRWLNGLAGETETLDQAIRLLAGDHLIPVLSVTSLMWLWLAGADYEERVRFQGAALDGLLALGIASLVASVLALMVARSRPFLDPHDAELLFYAPTDYSFPAHAVAVLVALGTAVRAGYKRLGNVVITAGVAMGLARVIAGVQWPSDVLAGIVIGVLVGLSAHALLDKAGPVRKWLTRALLGAPTERTASFGKPGEKVLRH
ncbi:MAG: phosphatase PAP2 family protein [Acidimicrobiia bacterium]